MKTFYSNLPIRLKLTAAIVSTSFLVLTLFSAAFIAEEIFSFRQTMVGNIAVLADLLGTNSQESLLLKKSIQAERVLSSLKAQQHIRAAYLFDSTGKPHAQYIDRSDVTFVNDALSRDFQGQELGSQGSSSEQLVNFRWDYVSLLAPVTYHGDRVGTIYLLSDNRELHARILGLLFGLLVAMGLMVPFSLLLARYLTGPIAGPLLNLVDKMAKISRQNDFSVRAEKRSNDEVGELVDGFNDMLTQIEIRDGKLFDHQRFLEDTVDNRTRELRETVSMLEKAKQVADAANQAKSQFLANITHELRTPLIGVLGMNELLARTSLSEQQQVLVETVQRSGDDLLAMINDILDFSKIEAGHMPLEPIRTDIAKVVEETVRLLAQKAYEKGLQINCRIQQQALWQVTADPVRIRQILLNLLGNAIKFTEQGEIEVSLALIEQSHGLGRFVIEVVDSGVGMSEEVQSKVFTAFVQADSTTTRQHGGTGLGLAIVQQLVLLMGGTMSLDSHEGQGSRFRIEVAFPLLEIAAPTLPDSMAGRRVLIYEEIDTDQTLLHEICLEFGLQVVEATSPEDAWYSLLNEQRNGVGFDFVLFPFESRLPDDGLLYEHVAREPQLAGVHLIGLALRREKIYGRELPESVQVLDKPILRSELVKVLIRSWQKIGLVAAPTESDRQTVQLSDELHVSADQHRFNMLLADDNRVTRELVVLSLRNYSLTIDQVSSGVEALVALRSKRYDLVLMDCNMPELDGMDATRQIRDGGDETPIIALTAHVDHRVHAACHEAGMNDLLRKPFRQNELHSIVEKWLGDGCRLSPAPSSDEIQSGGDV